MSANVTPLPCFNFAETERVARAIGFNPKNDEVARECMECAREVKMDFSGDLSEKLQNHALFYVALGIFIYDQFVEPGEPIAPFVRDWYEMNTALTVGGTQAHELFAWKNPALEED